MRTEVATYRLQLSSEFTLDDAAAIAGYLSQLGISHLYSSPVLQAGKGSTHGYDVLDHSRVSKELGGEAAFERVSTALRTHDLGLLLDIVPNHMAIGGKDNVWWWDVFENGQSSAGMRRISTWNGCRRKANCTIWSCCRYWATTTAGFSMQASFISSVTMGPSRSTIRSMRFPLLRDPFNLSWLARRLKRRLKTWHFLPIRWNSYPHPGPPIGSACAAVIETRHSHESAHPLSPGRS